MLFLISWDAFNWGGFEYTVYYIVIVDHLGEL